MFNQGPPTSSGSKQALTRVANHPKSANNLSGGIGAFMATAWRDKGAKLWKNRPLFDRRSRLAWAIALCALLMQQTLFAMAGLKLTSHELWWTVAAGVVLTGVAGMLRRHGSQNVSTMIEALALLVIAGLTCAILQYPMIALGGPLADRGLLAADKLLGFDWATFTRFFAHRTTDVTLVISYELFRVQGALVIVYLCVTGQSNRAWQLLTAAIGSLLIAVLLLALFAADGSFVGCGLRLDDLPFHAKFCAYGPVIIGIKSGAIHMIDPSLYYGLVSLPSFHVAGGVMLIWAVWHRPWLRWPSLALNFLMGIASIVIGGHYLVDVIGGVLLAYLAIVTVKAILPEDRAMPTFGTW